MPVHLVRGLQHEAGHADARSPAPIPMRPDFGVTPREKMPSMNTAAIEGASSDCTSCR